MATERHWNSGLMRTVLEGPGEAQLRPHRSRVRHSPPLQQPHEAPTAPRTATGAPGTGQAACETAPRSQVTTGHRPLCLPPKLQRSRAELPRQRGLRTLKEGPAATPTPRTRAAPARRHLTPGRPRRFSLGLGGSQSGREPAPAADGRLAALQPAFPECRRHATGRRRARSRDTETAGLRTARTLPSSW